MYGFAVMMSISTSTTSKNIDTITLFREFIVTQISQGMYDVNCEWLQLGLAAVKRGLNYLFVHTQVFISSKLGS